MSNVFTLFARLRGSLSAGDDTDPETSGLYNIGNGIARHNVKYYRSETVALDDTDTRTIAFPYNPTDWVMILAKVVGEAKLDIDGVDLNHSTPISGNIVGYGTDPYPGVIGTTVYGATGIVLTGLADGTKVTYLVAILATDAEI